MKRKETAIFQEQLLTMIIILRLYIHEFHEDRSPGLGTISKLHRFGGNYSKVDYGSYLCAWWHLARYNISYARTIITSMITAPAKICEVYALFQLFFTHGSLVAMEVHVFVVASSVYTNYIVCLHSRIHRDMTTFYQFEIDFTYVFGFWVNRNLWLYYLFSRIFYFSRIFGSWYLIFDILRSFRSREFIREEAGK